MKSSDPVLRSFVDQGMVARIATISGTGRPHVNPIYFVEDSDRLHLGTATYTLAARNVEATPAVQVLLDIEAERDDLRLLRMTGTATVRTDAPTLDRYRKAVARKYVVHPRGLWNMLVHPRQWRPMRRHLSGGEACVIEFTPTNMEVVEAPSLPAHR